MLMLFFIALQDYKKLLSSKHARFLSAVSKHKCGPRFIGWTPTQAHTHTHTHTHLMAGLTLLFRLALVGDERERRARQSESVADKADESCGRKEEKRGNKLLFEENVKISNVLQCGD